MKKLFAMARSNETSFRIKSNIRNFRTPSSDAVQEVITSQIHSSGKEPFFRVYVFYITNIKSNN